LGKFTRVVFFLTFFLKEIRTKKRGARKKFFVLGIDSLVNGLFFVYRLSLIVFFYDGLRGRLSLLTI